MSLRSQLCFANTLMTIGVLPWLLMLAWAAVFYALTPPGGPPAIPILDPIGIIGFMGMSFLFGLCVAGAGAFWSWVLTRDGEEGTRASRVFRSAVLLAMLGPLLMQWLALKLGIWT